MPVAKQELSLTIRVADMERFKLFLWELWQLQDDMRVMASPHAERLERLLDRLADGGDDENEPERSR